MEMKKDIKDSIRNEIDKVMRKNGGSLKYDGIKEMS
jgi:hypothetical protein